MMYIHIFRNTKHDDDGDLKRDNQENQIEEEVLGVRNNGYIYIYIYNEEYSRLLLEVLTG